MRLHLILLGSFHLRQDTVNTVPLATLAASLDHGQVRPGSLEENVAEAKRQMAALETLGVSSYTVTGELEQEGVKSFVDAFTALLNAVEARRKAVILAVT